MLSIGFMLGLIAIFVFVVRVRRNGSVQAQKDEIISEGFASLESLMTAARQEKSPRKATKKNSVKKVTSKSKVKSSSAKKAVVRKSTPKKAAPKKR